MPLRVPGYRPARPGPLASVLNARSRKRREADRFYASIPWRRLRVAFLATSPLCKKCEDRGDITPAEHVHHVKDRRTYPELALDWNNLMSLCTSCHSRLHRSQR